MHTILNALRAWSSLLSHDGRVAFLGASTGLLGVALGAVIGLIGARSAARLQVAEQTRAQRQSHLNRERFDIYMRLLDISSSYFWVSAHELHNEPLSVDLQRRIRDLTWQLLDKIRSIDDLPEIPEIVRLLTDAGAFDTASARDGAIRGLLDRLGSQVNPRFQKAVQATTPSNLNAAAVDTRKRDITPALMSGLFETPPIGISRSGK